VELEVAPLDRDLRRDEPADEIQLRTMSAIAKTLAPMDAAC
jgi:hypothetical protein